MGLFPFYSHCRDLRSFTRKICLSTSHSLAPSRTQSSRPTANQARPNPLFYENGVEFAQLENGAPYSTLASEVPLGRIWALVDSDREFHEPASVFQEGSFFVIFKRLLSVPCTASGPGGFDTRCSIRNYGSLQRCFRCKSAYSWGFAMLTFLWPLTRWTGREWEGVM